MNKERQLLKQIISKPSQGRLLLHVLALVLFPFVALIVYQSGGTQYAYLHAMYIPIALSAFLYGWKGGLLAGVLAGLILGPLMPVNVDTGQMQSFTNWFYRLLSFTSLGVVVGFLFDFLYKQYQSMQDQNTHNNDTGLPNFNFYKAKFNVEEKHSNRVAMTLQINNYEPLVILLGREAYYEVLKNLYENIKLILPPKAVIIQVDSRRFWIDLSQEDYETMNTDFTKDLEDKTFYGEHVPLYLDFSLGFSLPNKPKNTLERFNESDIAALHAKNNALKYVVFHQAHKKDQLLIKRLGELPLALKNEELFLVYQPLLDIKTKKTVGLEALIRWQYKDQILTPNEFIPLAEETRVIDQITEWVLKQLIEDYQDFSKVAPKIKMAMNISQRNLFDPSLIENMITEIKKHDMADKLEIEMTESTLMLNRAMTQSFLESFRHIGVKSILDDFGTGYSSLSCLRDLPVDKVKIDRDFTLNINKNHDTKLLVKAIIDLAHYMNLDVIAEGVEDEEILAELEELDCDYIQGFLFSMPLSRQEIIAYLKKNLT